MSPDNILKLVMVCVCVCVCVCDGTKVVNLVFF